MAEHGIVASGGLGAGIYITGNSTGHGIMATGVSKQQSTRRCCFCEIPCFLENAVIGHDIEEVVLSTQKTHTVETIIFHRLFNCLISYYIYKRYHSGNIKNCNLEDTVRDKLVKIVECSVEDLLLHVNAECPVILAVTKYRLENNV